MVKAASIRRRPSWNKVPCEDENIIGDPVACFKYVEMVNKNMNKNERKLQDCGLIDKTSTPNKLTNTPKSIKSPETTSIEKWHGVKSCNFQTYKAKIEKIKCLFNHQLYSTNYDEETNKQYVGPDYNLFQEKCQACKEEFSMDPGDDTIVPTFTEPL